MSILWVAIAVTTAGVLALVVLPLTRKPEGSAPDRVEYDIAVYKDQLSEVECDLERGLLNAEQAEAVRTEIHRKLLHAADGGNLKKKGRSGADKPSPVLAGGILLVTAAATLALYDHLGSPGLKNLAHAERDLQAERQARDDDAERDMQRLLSDLARRLEQNPNDLEGWLLLGRSLVSRRRYEEAAGAYSNAHDLRPGNPDIAVDYAEALTFADRGLVSEQARAVLEKAFSLSRRDPKIRYYIGVHKAQQDDFHGAIQEWVNIAAMSPENAPWMPTVRNRIAKAAQESGIDPSTVNPSAEAREIGRAMAAAARQAERMEGQPGEPGPTAEQVEAARQMSAGDRSEMIRGMVSRLAERLGENPGDLDGWKRLLRAYRVLGETDKANEVADKIKALQGR